MKRCGCLILFIMAVLMAASLATTLRAETETIDLKALAKKARPAVMLLVVSDAAGKEIATGTGFLVSSDGKLITNHHVIEHAASAVAKAENGGLFPVEGVLADDPKNDLVLLKLKGKDLPFLPLGNSDKIEGGTRIAVIGSPLGLEGTLSEGIVSAVRELVGNVKVLQVTAAISPGSSGSPVMNAKGDVIGVASALLRGGQALNFALPIDYANRLLANVHPSAKPQPLGQFVSSGQDAIFSDPDFWAALDAEYFEDHVEKLKRAKLLAARYPDNAWVHFYLGRAYGSLNLFDDAAGAFRQAAKLKPDEVVTWHELGVVCTFASRYEEAIAALRQAIKLKPDHGGAWKDLGVAYRWSGHTEEADAAFRRAGELKPELVRPPE